MKQLFLDFRFWIVLDLKSVVFSNELSRVTCDCLSYVSSHTLKSLWRSAGRHLEGTDYMKLCVQYLSYIYNEEDIMISFYNCIREHAA